MTASDIRRNLFVTGLRDAHAVEHQALALMDRQIGRLEHFQQVEDRLVAHRRETEQQIERLDNLLADLDESASGLKDTALGIGGNLAALSHAMAPDEIIKNSFANFAFENFEMAAYSGLITLAEQDFAFAVEPLRATLTEERAMAAWLEENQPLVIRQYVALREQGETPR